MYNEGRSITSESTFDLILRLDMPGLIGPQDSFL